jgi:hypothetical protein
MLNWRHAAACITGVFALVGCSSTSSGGGGSDEADPTLPRRHDEAPPDLVLGRAEGVPEETQTEADTGGSDSDAGADADAVGSDAATDANRTDADGGSCTPKVFDEGLATTLRGVIFGGGYYRIGESRVAGAVNQNAIIVGSCGVSGVDRCDKYVFSTFSADSYVNGTRIIDVRDARGSRFELNMTYNAAQSCWSVAYARINGANVTVNTQSYTTGVLNTCGATGEPAFSTASCPP